MTIQVENAVSQPELIFNRVFMRDLHITQAMNNDNEARPFYVLTVEVFMYAVDGEGRRHFQNKSNTLKITDYDAVARVKALAGDMDLANAGAAIETALGKILEDQYPELGTVTVAL